MRYTSFFCDCDSCCYLRSTYARTRSQQLGQTPHCQTPLKKNVTSNKHIRCNNYLQTVMLVDKEIYLTSTQLKFIKTGSSKAEHTNTVTICTDTVKYM